MTLFNNKYRIESTRLQGWDYASSGLYFVTLCIQNKASVLGDVVNLEMHLSPTGETACKNWLAIPEHTSGNITLDAFVIMPNHIHGILAIENAESRRDATMQRLDHSNKPTNEIMSTIAPKAGEIGAIIRSYKSSVTRWCNENQISFAWQSRFYDHIIRTEKELQRIRHYIEANPAKWNADKENPINLWM